MNHSCVAYITGTYTWVIKISGNVYKSWTNIRFVLLSIALKAYDDCYSSLAITSLWNLYFINLLLFECVIFYLMPML